MSYLKLGWRRALTDEGGFFGSGVSVWRNWRMGLRLVGVTASASLGPDTANDG